MNRLLPVALIACFLTANAVRADMAPRKPREPAPSTAPAPPARPQGSLTDGNADGLTMVVGGAALTLALAVGGVWLVRRIGAHERFVRETVPFSMTGRTVVKDKRTQASEPAEKN